MSCPIFLIPPYSSYFSYHSYQQGSGPSHKGQCQVIAPENFFCQLKTKHAGPYTTHTSHTSHSTHINMHNSLIVKHKIRFNTKHAQTPYPSYFSYKSYPHTTKYSLTRILPRPYTLHTPHTSHTFHTTHTNIHNSLVN